MALCAMAHCHPFPASARLSDWTLRKGVSASRTLGRASSNSLMNPARAIADLQSRMEVTATKKTKAWMEKYMRNRLEARGLKTPAVVKTVDAWYEENSLHELSVPEQKEIARDLMASGFAEDKLSCVLVYQTKLIPKSHVVWREELPVFVSFFEKGWICNWSSCDALCMRVLANLIKYQEEPSEKEACARAIASWHNSDLLWQKRASIVSFVTLAKHGDENFPRFKEMLLDACAGVVKSDERFAQTGVGWVVREIGKGDENSLLRFVRDNLSQFSREGLRYALEKVCKKEREEIMDEHKSLKRSGSEQTSTARKKRYR